MHALCACVCADHVADRRSFFRLLWGLCVLVYLTPFPSVCEMVRPSTAVGCSSNRDDLFDAVVVVVVVVVIRWSLSLLFRFFSNGFYPLSWMLTLYRGAWRQNMSAVALAVVGEDLKSRSQTAGYPHSRLNIVRKIDMLLAISQAEAWQSQAPLPD
jgi:hypothetical protein